MDFYEELGLPRSASLDAIRRSYRQRVRLLHPDRYPNAELRAIAEAEMQRVNVIAGILTCPEERLRYDRTLIGEAAAADQGKAPIARSLPSRRRLDIKVFALWLVAGAAAGLTCIFAFRTDPASVPTVPLVAASPASTANANANPAQPESLPGRIPLSPLEGKRGADTKASVVRFARSKMTPVQPGIESVGADKPLRAPAPANPASRPAEPVAEVHIDAADRPAPLSPDEIRPVRRSAGLAGLWRYARPAQQQALPDGFAVQEAEVGITRQFGIVYGYYQGRHVVPQGRDSRELSFQFSGTAKNESVRTIWSSTDGSRGEITLRMLSEDSLEVVWVASHLGGPGRVASGKITLARVE